MAKPLFAEESSSEGRGTSEQFNPDETQIVQSTFDGLETESLGVITRFHASPLFTQQNRAMYAAILRKAELTQKKMLELEIGLEELRDDLDMIHKAKHYNELE